MPTSVTKYIKSKYKYVSGKKISNNTYWEFRIEGTTRQSHKTEKAAALAADLFLIDQGKDPVNILKRVV